MSIQAGCACLARAVALAGGLVLVLLSGCAMPERAPKPVLYDFGVDSAESTQGAAVHGLPALALSAQALPALEGTAVLYRLAYVDARQLRAYTLARWTMPPAELVQQRLRHVLGQQRAVLKPGEGAARVLQLELEEFSQVFETPERSKGLLRLRATVLQSSGNKLLGQRDVLVQRPAPSADAAGGTRALAAATDAAVAELAQWLQTLP